MKCANDPRRITRNGLGQRRKRDAAIRECWRSSRQSQTIVTQIDSQLAITQDRVASTDAGHEIIKLYHKSLSDWLADEAKAGAHFVSVAAGHSLLADLFWTEFDNGQGVPTMSHYALRHARFHMQADGSNEHLLEINANPGFRRRRMEIGLKSIFFSYARGEDDSFVRRLHGDITQKGFDVWWDQVSMPSRQLTFQQEVRDAIHDCDQILLVVSRKVTSQDYVYVADEWRYALDVGKPIIPVLRIGDYPCLPEELRLLHCEDFRDDTHYVSHFQELLRQISEPIASLGKLVAVPSLPGSGYLSRWQVSKVFCDTLLSDLKGPVGLHGIAGIGKSVLANLLARQRIVRRKFLDGVVWIELGHLPSITELQRRVHRDLGGDGAIATEHEGKTRLKELLADKSVLLVLDDVWRRSDVDAFNVLGPHCRALITTRDAGLLKSLGGTHHIVEPLTDAEAFGLLSVASGVSRDALPSEARDIVAVCGGLPLAVSMCGGLVSQGFSFSSVLEELRQARIDRVVDRRTVEP